MAILKSNVLTYLTDYICDFCEKSSLKCDGMSTDPKNIYVHTCPSCNQSVNLDKEYPIITYVKSNNV